MTHALAKKYGSGRLRLRLLSNIKVMHFLALETLFLWFRQKEKNCHLICRRGCHISCRGCLWHRLDSVVGSCDYVFILPPPPPVPLPSSLARWNTTLCEPTTPSSPVPKTPSTRDMTSMELMLIRLKVLGVRCTPAPLTGSETLHCGEWPVCYLHNDW